MHKDRNMPKSDESEDQPASELITKRIADLGDWRGETLGRMRKLIKDADPDVIEEWKWMGTPVWSHGGIICTGETYKAVVKLTFAKAAPASSRALCARPSSSIRRCAARLTPATARQTDWPTRYSPLGG